MFPRLRCEARDALEIQTERYSTLDYRSRQIPNGRLEDSIVRLDASRHQSYNKSQTNLSFYLVIPRASTVPLLLKTNGWDLSSSMTQSCIRVSHMMIQTQAPSLSHIDLSFFLTNLPCSLQHTSSMNFEDVGTHGPKLFICLSPARSVSEAGR